jgi:p-aminobenzoyl-glutamate transporter AbgT
MKNYPDFWHTIIGNGPAGSLLAFMVLAYICAFISIMIEVSNRDVKSPATPEKFSVRFLMAANLARIAANFLLIPIFIRLLYEYTDSKLMLFLCLGIGFGVDRLAMIAKQYGILTTNKIASKVADKINEADSSPKN